MGSLPGLDAVSWASLHGTYRSAEDVPAMLEALRSPDPEVHRQALDESWGAVIHQGTRWQVSAHVVPFLVQLIDDPTAVDRSILTKLLRHIGVGLRDDRSLPLDPTAEFARLGTHTVTPEQEAMVVERVYYLEEEITEDWVPIADACALKWDADAYHATEAHVDTVRSTRTTSPAASGTWSASPDYRP